MLNYEMNRLTPILLLPVLACSNQVTYEDPEAVETLTAEFGATDLMMIAHDMTQGFLGSGTFGDEKPIVVFGGIQNRTAQRIDTRSISDTIQTSLLQSGKFTIVAGDSGLEEIDREIALQRSGKVDMAYAAEMGRQKGAEFVLYGRMSEIHKEAGRTESRWVKFTLNAVNVQTREILWADEVTISKRETKALLGW